MSQQELQHVSISRLTLAGAKSRRVIEYPMGTLKWGPDLHIPTVVHLKVRRGLLTTDPSLDIAEIKGIFEDVPEDTIANDVLFSHVAASNFRQRIWLELYSVAGVLEIGQLLGWASVPEDSINNGAVSTRTYRTLRVMDIEGHYVHLLEGPNNLPAFAGICDELLVSEF